MVQLISIVELSVLHFFIVQYFLLLSLAWLKEWLVSFVNKLLLLSDIEVSHGVMTTYQVLSSLCS